MFTNFLVVTIGGIAVIGFAIFSIVNKIKTLQRSEPNSINSTPEFKLSYCQVLNDR